MVHDPVDHGGDGVVAEDFTPIADRQVASQDQEGVFVWAGDELEEQVRCLGFKREIADFVHDQQWVPPQACQFLVEGSGAVTVGEPVDPSIG